MGIFDFLKSEEEKEQDEAARLLKKLTERKKARNEAADELISESYDNLVINGEIANGVGRFGLDATNPIPIKGFSGLDHYFERLCLQKRIRWDRRGSTSVDNINGMIDIYILTTANGETMGRLYVTMYSSETSTKIPEGF
jgi:hypothetical protein